MRRYIRQRRPGGIYFFTVVTHDRRPILASEEHVGRLRAAFHWVKQRHPFKIDAIVILPDHLHCIWRLPDGDDDFPMRWAQIKRRFSISINTQSTLSKSQDNKRERGIWQRRYWEHLIRDERDWRRHMDYIHYNPVKHGYVQVARGWRYSSFAACVRKGWYEWDWGGNAMPTSIVDMELE